MPLVAFATGERWVPFTGVWSGATAYPIGSLVDHQGVAYYALQASTNVTPTPGAIWAPISSVVAELPIPGPAGPPGTNGTNGSQGIQGIQGIQGVPGPNILSVVKLTADETGKTDATLVNTGLTIPVVNGSTYQFLFTGAYRSTVLTVGLKIGMTVPAFTVFSAQAHIGGFAADGAASSFFGVINTSGDSVISTATAVINVDMPWSIRGIIVPSANGNIVVQYAAETTGATVTLRRGSVGVVTII